MAQAYTSIKEYSQAKDDLIESKGVSPALRSCLSMSGRLNPEYFDLAKPLIPVSRDYAQRLSVGILEGLSGGLSPGFTFDWANFRSPRGIGESLYGTIITLSDSSGILGGVEVEIARQPETDELPIGFESCLPWGREYSGPTKRILDKLSTMVRSFDRVEQISTATEKVLARDNNVWRRAGFLICPAPSSK